MVQRGCQTVRETGRLSGERSFLVFACAPMKSNVHLPVLIITEMISFFFSFFILFHSFFFSFFILLPARFPMQPTNVYQGSDHGSHPWLTMGSFQGLMFQGSKVGSSFNGLNLSFGFGLEIPKSFIHVV